MGLLTLLAGPLQTTESTIHSRNPILSAASKIIPTNMPKGQAYIVPKTIQELHDEKQQLPSVFDTIGQVGDKVHIFEARNVEVLPPTVVEDVRMVTAYFDQHIVIPWLHGDQRMTK